MDAITRNAIKKSIKHWEKDILKHFQDGDKVKKFQLYWINSKKRLKLSTYHCALCKLFFINDCIACPLMDIDKCCLDEHSPYDNFILKPNITNAKKMISVLKSLLKERK